MYYDFFYINDEYFEDFGGDLSPRGSGDFDYFFYIEYWYSEDFGRNILHRESGDCG